jgi:hypothetical protein
MSVRLFVGNLPYSATEVDIRQPSAPSATPCRSSFRPTARPAGREDSPS